jgi:hypothetical protein
MGLGDQWSLIFTRSFNLIVHFNQCVLIIIEQFSKWIELTPLQNKSGEGVAYAFLDQVLSRFGVLMEALERINIEFQKEF